MFKCELCGAEQGTFITFYAKREKKHHTNCYWCYFGRDKKIPNDVTLQHTYLGYVVQAVFNVG